MPRMTNIGLLAAVIAVSPFAITTQANEIEVGAGLPYFLFDNNLETHDKFGLRLFGGMRFNERWGIELMHDRINTEFDAGGDLDVRQTAINGMFYGDMIGKVEPFVTAGWGQVTFSSDFMDNDSTVTNFGGGVKVYMSDQWVLRPSVNYFLPTEGDDGYSSFSVSISYLINHKAPSIKKSVLAPTPQDADGDGVVDVNDQCPQTPSGVSVDSAGCPLDDDKDGVFNYLDKCPGTALKLKVDASGCPMALSETVEIDLNVNFDSSSAVIKPEYYPEITRVATFLEQYANTSVIIEGHTDTSGAAAYNKSLSQKRADAVAKVLVSEMGIAASRVSSVGFGEERPIADDATPEGKRANRRVVAKVSATVKSMQTK